MAKNIIKYICNNATCNNQSTYSLGICPKCGQGGTYEKIVETIGGKSQSSSGIGRTRISHSKLTKLANLKSAFTKREDTGIKELNRVLGGGLVPGSIVLIGGEPGIGKTTLLFAAAANLANSVGPVLYASAEESMGQNKGRADRLGIKSDNLYLVFESDIDIIIEQHVRDSRAKVLIIDSITTVSSADSASSAGSPTQMKLVAKKLTELAKSTGIAVFAIGHVTKGGEITGPKTLEHMVDVVLYLEGDPNYMFRLLRAHKNRFGAIGEIGVFSMEGTGMVEVPNPSEAFLAGRMTDKSGSAVSITIEGNRPLAVEIQALVMGDSDSPARRSNGIDRNRSFMLTAVLQKFVDNMHLSDCDVFLNVVGGMTISEPAADLATIVAISSSYLNIPVPPDLIAVGEVGLTGELRMIPHIELRIREAVNLGFTKIIVPQYTMKRKKSFKVPKSVKLMHASTVAEALEIISDQY